MGRLPVAERGVLGMYVGRGMLIGGGALRALERLDRAAVALLRGWGVGHAEVASWVAAADHSADWLSYRVGENERITCGGVVAERRVGSKALAGAGLSKEGAVGE